MMNKIPIAIFMCFYSQQIFAQNQMLITSPLWHVHLKNKIDAIEETLDKQSQLRFKAGFQNKIIFAGRNFGENQFGATIATVYHHRSGLNAEYNGNFWSGMPNKYALSEAGISYEFSVSENFYASAGYWRLFFHNGDSEERNLFTNFFLIDENWYSSLGQVNLTYYYITGTEHAHRLDINFSKSIDFYQSLGADKISIEPTFTTTLATVNYFLFLSGTAEPAQENLDAFKVGNYEFMLPVIYRKLGKLEVSAAWHYAVPVGVTAKEHLQPLPYFTFELTRIVLFNKTK